MRKQVLPRLTALNTGIINSINNKISSEPNQTSAFQNQTFESFCPVRVSRSLDVFLCPGPDLCCPNKGALEYFLPVKTLNDERINQNA